MSNLAHKPLFYYYFFFLQKQTIPAVLSGDNVLCAAQTGQETYVVLSYLYFISNHTFRVGFCDILIYCYHFLTNIIEEIQICSLSET